MATSQEVGRITREEADSLIAARDALWALKRRSLLEHDDQASGMIYAAADAAYDALHYVLNVADAFGRDPVAKAAIERDTAAYAGHGGPRR